MTISARGNSQLPRVRAPELVGATVLNADGRVVRLADRRGRFVLLDFWSAGCVNCVHVLDELRTLDEQRGEVLDIIGVHSPKFTHLTSDIAVSQAIDRFEIDHPVVNDANFALWNAYAAKAWPTLVLVDPAGYVVGHFSGEGHGEEIAQLIDALKNDFVRDGVLVRGRRGGRESDTTSTALRFPGKAIHLAPSGDGLARVLVADAGHHSLAVLDPVSGAVIRRYGTGRPGRGDGADSAQFRQPRGMGLLPVDIAREVGYDVVVADTANHLLRGLDLTSGQVITLAGDGRRGLGAPDEKRSLASPTDAVWWRDRVWVAVSGDHQLWTFDPRSGALAHAAGTGHEGLVDGPYAEAWFAQPTGLAPDGERIWVVDAESSSLRWLDDAGVHTAVGQGLFDFGLRDGPSEVAQLQHPVSVTVAGNGQVLIADSYNDAVRRFDPATRQLSTVVTAVSEPAGIVDLGSSIGVVESGAHRLVHVASDATAVLPAAAPPAATEPVRRLASTGVDLVLSFTPPPGQHLDERYGEATSVTVSSTPTSLLRSGDGTDSALTRRLVVDRAVSDGYLHIAARAVSCDEHSDVGAACHLHQRDWTLPIVVAGDGESTLALTIEP